MPPWTSVAGLEQATDVDAVADAVLRWTTGATDGPLRGSLRAGLALTEGGGRRLLFTASERLADPEGAVTAEGSAPAAPTNGSADGTGLDWCHIDAYDDVPLTRAVRSGRAVAGELDALGLDAAFVERQRGAGVSAIVAVPLLRPVSGERLGGLVVFLDRVPADGLVEGLRGLADAVAAALLRVRATAAPAPPTAAPTTPPTAQAGADDAAAPDRRTARLRLAGDPRDPAAARDFVRDRLSAWGAGEDGDLGELALLCVSELVTNAVVHTGATTDVDLAWEGGRLLLGVRDYGAVAVPAERLTDGVGDLALAVLGLDDAGQDAGEDAPLVVHGRGLSLVAAMSEDWGVEQHDPGLRVWCLLGP